MPQEPQQEAPEQAAISKRIREIAQQIAELRGWTVEAGMTYENASLSRIRQAMAADMHDQISAWIVADQTRFLESFGWVPRDFNLEDAVLATFAPEVVGLYSLSWRRILLRKAAQSAVSESALRHELVHAFQDRYFGLSERAQWAPNRGDEIAGIHALSEGEAVCIARQLEDPERKGCLRSIDSSNEDRIFDDEVVDLPLAIRYGLLAPYVDGIRFVTGLLRAGGWSRVDEAWHRGIHSTQELFRANSSLNDVLKMAPPLDACRADFVDVLGEQGLASILFNKRDAPGARRLASLLSADRAAYWKCRHACFGVWHIRAQTTEGARALAAAFRSTLGISTTTDFSGSYCSTAPHWTGSLSTQVRDIVITSMHNCERSNGEIATLSCTLVTDWARRLIDASR